MFGCPVDSVISVFHLEEGEYTLEFEHEDHPDFNMAILKMPGGHAHHDHHGHGSGPYEWAGIFSISDSAHTWTMEKKDGAYADPSMKVVIIPTDTPTEATMHALEDGAATLIEGDSCVVVQDGGTMTPIAPEGSCFELKVGTGDMSTFNMDTTGMTGFAAFTAHSPYEFENNQHYLKDSSGNDVEHVAEEGGGGHDDHGHGDHGDEDGHGDGHDDEMTPELALQSFDSNNDSHISWGEFWAGWTSDDHDDHGDDDHDDHDDEHESKIYDGCTGSTDPHDAYYECWMDDWLDEDGNIIMSDGYDEEECTELANYSWECEHHDPFEEAMEEYVADLLMQSFNQSDSCLLYTSPSPRDS